VPPLSVPALEVPALEVPPAPPCVVPPDEVPPAPPCVVPPDEVPPAPPPLVVSSLLLLHANAKAATGSARQNPMVLFRMNQSLIPFKGASNEAGECQLTRL
jgi:hypothetical protein